MSADVEAEFNDWYDNVHLQDVVAVDGFVSAQRFRVVDVGEGPDRPAPAHRYLALYEADTDDIDAIAAELMARAGTDSMMISPALDSGTAQTFWVEPIGAPVLAG
jgi:hypothetical protein